MSLEDQIAQTVDATLFTRLCNSLFTAEHGHSYQVIDGSRGDEGNDGWIESEKRILAIYCPLKPERRTDADYRAKAYSDLDKAAILRENNRYPVERWTFVTPRKLSNDVIVSIRTRAEQLGLEANHVEATYLAGLLLKYPELVKEFPDYHANQIEELLLQLLDSQEVKNPEPAQGPERDLFISYSAMQSAVVKDEELKEVIALRDSDDRVAAKRGLRALIYRSTNPFVQINAVIGLFDSFDPMRDDVADLVNFCETGLGAARRLGSKSAEAYLLAQRGFYHSWEFGHLSALHKAQIMAVQAIGFSVEDPADVARRQNQIQELWTGYTEAFKDALELAQESNSGPAIAAVLILIGNAAGLRATGLAQTGPREAFEHERNVCKRALLAARDIYAQLGEELEVANAQFNLANQIRFFGEVEEAKQLIGSVIPVAEAHGYEDLLRKAKQVEERLRTGKIPDHLGGEEAE